MTKEVTYRNRSGLNQCPLAIWSHLQLKGTVSQVEAADLTLSTTFFTDSRSSRTAFQQPSSGFRALSQRPSSDALLGLLGLVLARTSNTTSGQDRLSNFPVRNCAVSAWYVVVAVAYTSTSFVGVHLSSPNFNGTCGPGAMKGAAHQTVQPSLETALQALGYAQPS